MKKILLSLFITLILSNNAYSEVGCSQIKKLSKDYLSCLAKKTKEKTSNLGLDTSNIKEKKTLADWFKKKK
jgi:hypothetical protein|tara:strand:- start:492 stop:704 length:213 start_codon:yes stop_codon:yes gene_type:complete